MASPQAEPSAQALGESLAALAVQVAALRGQITQINQRLDQAGLHGIVRYGVEARSQRSKRYARVMTREIILATDFDIEATGCQLIESRLAQSSKVRVVKPLAGGYTEALLLLCDNAADDGVAENNGHKGQ